MGARANLDLSLAPLTVVYGGNGTGKSGYARLVKQLCGARAAEPIHGNVFTQERDPISARYAAKLVALLGLLVFASVVLCLLIPVGGWLLTLTAGSPLVGLPPRDTLLGRVLATVLAALPMIAAQLFIVIRWHSFSPAKASGIIATMIATFTPLRISVIVTARFG